MNKSTQAILPIDTEQSSIIEEFGARLYELDPIGAIIENLDLAANKPPPDTVLQALEYIMACRGFIVFKSKQAISEDQFLQASCWWGGKALHSTHGVHPATPNGNPHIFRLSNDTNEGILGVGPQWHNDGSFNPGTFSHAGYHMVRAPEKGGGTCFAHQSAAFDALEYDQQDYWSRLSSVNATSGIVHPMVHLHPLIKRKSVWLHLGMTGAVIMKDPKENLFRLLDPDELKILCNQYNDLLNAGFENGYSINYEYDTNDCLFIDNLAVAHRAAPEAHLPAEKQGLRIMHRSTIQAVDSLKPNFGLPIQLDIYSPSPLGEGVWQPGGIGFRWDDEAPMQN